MSTTTTRAAQVASIHLAPINASRKRVGLPALTLVEAEREFADVNRAPFRAKAVAPRTTSGTGADDLWNGIVAKLNATLPVNRAPITSARTSPASGDAEGRIVDWSAIARDLNASAGLKTPARRA